jgi:hypothetical protein
MSDQGENPNGTASPAGGQIQIPKYRLDEEIAAKRRLEAELEATKGLLARMMPQQGPVTPEDPEMEELKESNPVLYKKLREQELRTKQVSAAMFQQNEEMDRVRFINYAGQEEANRIGQTVEARLDELRKRGNFTMSRADLYNYLVGQEAVQTKRAPKAPPKAPVAGTPAQGTATVTQTQEDAPSSDPSEVQVPAPSAAQGGKELSLEELEARLINVTF